MISVIVPVYKTEKYLSRCVKSICNQSYKNLEIILVDDGSPDNCGRICDELASEDARIQVIHQENCGLASARNVGLKRATGKYVSFIDSDDYIAKEMYEKMVLAIEKNMCDICMCSSIVVNENGKVLKREVYKNKSYMGLEIIPFCILPLKTAAWNKLIKKDSIKENTFPEGKIHGEDLVFFSNYFTEQSKLIAIDYCGYYYVKHSDSITTSTFSEKSFDEVYCKDLASIIITRKFPQYKQETVCWQFRARLNLVRQLISCKEIGYKSIVSTYLKWMRENYNRVSNLLTKKTKYEYKLLVCFPKLYIFVLKICEKGASI